MKAASKGLNKMEIFRSDQLGTMETTGRQANAFRPEGSVMIKGRNIGTGRNEPT